MFPHKPRKRSALETPRQVPIGPEGFSQLVDEHERSIFLYALCLLQNESEARQVVRETTDFLRRSSHEYQPGTDFVRWACRIAYSSVLRRRQEEVVPDRLFTDEFIGAMAAEMDRAWGEVHIRREALRSCLDRLSAEDRDLLKKRYGPGRTTRNLTERQDRSVKGSREALHRIRKNLLTCIERTVRGAA
jgi:RNA polymerase sigma-70 factor (ECF subfamily)